MKVVPFEAWHLHQLRLQPSQLDLQPMLTKLSYGEWLEKAGPAFSAVVDDAIIAAFGVIPQWENRTLAWGLVGEGARLHFLPLTRAIARFLDLTPQRRVETAVATDFQEGHRWAQMLGFQNEGTMRAYAPDGRDYDLYARVRH